MQEYQWIEFKKSLLNHVEYFNNIPLFSQIEFNLIAECTRQCSFCPVSDPKFYKQYDEKYFPKSLFDKILKQLKSINYSGIISFSGFCESLLYPDINSLILEVRKFLPQATIILTTNGDLLKKSLVKSLIKSGLDTLSISIYDKENEKYFSSLAKEFNKILIVSRRRYWDGKDYGFYHSNRACGADLNIPRPCYYPFFSLFVDLDGQVIPCVHDAWKQNIVGDVNNENIIDIWTGDKINKIRKSLIKNKRIGGCKTCSVNGKLTGEKFYEAWKQIL